MLGAVSWSYDVYLPPLKEESGPIITRIAPFNGGFHVEWIHAEGACRLFIRLRNVGEFCAIWEGNGCEADIASQLGMSHIELLIFTPEISASLPVNGTIIHLSSYLGS